MLFRRLGVLGTILLALFVPVASASAAPEPPVLTVSGAVADPASYTPGQLAGLPAETIKLPDGHGIVTATGVSLDLLVTMATPVLPAVKNALLRVIVTAGGPAVRPVSFKGGRYVSDVSDLVVGQGAPAS